MKTRHTILMVLFSFLMMNASDCSEKMDHTNDDQKNDKYAVIESEIYSTYLKGELEKIQVDKKKLIERIENGDKSAEEELSALKSEENNISTAIVSLKKETAQIMEGIAGRIKPLPPCPVSECGIGYLIVNDDVKILIVSILNSQMEQIGNVKLEPDPEIDLPGLNAYKINFEKKVEGNFVYNITRIGKDGVKINYRTPYSTYSGLN